MGGKKWHQRAEAESSLDANREKRLVMMDLNCETTGSLTSGENQQSKKVDLEREERD
jgi:hypothetical protein